MKRVEQDTERFKRLWPEDQAIIPKNYEAPLSLLSSRELIDMKKRQESKDPGAS